MIVVPDTINRITSVYKHYLEIGNFFAVKPRFIYEDKKLNIVDNPLTNKLELLNLKLYKKHFHRFDKHRKKFLNQVGKFPYSLSIMLKKRVRNKLLALIFKRLKKNSIQNTIYNKLNQNSIKYTAKNFVSTISY